MKLTDERRPCAHYVLQLLQVGCSSKRSDAQRYVGWVFFQMRWHTVLSSSKCGGALWRGSGRVQLLDDLGGDEDKEAHGRDVAPRRGRDRETHDRDTVPGHGGDGEKYGR
ncbi:OstA-like protein [Sesbania bispinosa]|nr:OstA-like protein [Sesbania bispinosa]